jgi:lipopolysaccharide transport system permease protein
VEAVTAGKGISIVATNTESISFPEPPALRITPLGRWWVIPIRELWNYRELLYFIVWRELKVRYKQTAVGAAWALLQPFLTMLVFSLFFGKLGHIPSEGLPYPVFYYSALLPWTYFAASLQAATNKIVENQHVITKVYFPRLILPISGVLCGLVDFGISLLMFVAIMAYYRMHPSGAIVILPVFLLLALLTALGVGLWLSALNALYRDVRFVVPFLVQFWMFASPVAYPSSLVPEKWRWLYELNPMAGVIDGFRWSLTGSGEPSTTLLLASLIVVIAVLFGGLMYFQKTEATMADVV